MTGWIVHISTLDETRKIESGTSFATPLEILPELYLMSVFNLLRMLSDKLVGVLTMLTIQQFSRNNGQGFTSSLVATITGGISFNLDHKVLITCV